MFRFIVCCLTVLVLLSPVLSQADVSALEAPAALYPHNSWLLNTEVDFFWIPDHSPAFYLLEVYREQPSGPERIHSVALTNVSTYSLYQGLEREQLYSWVLSACSSDGCVPAERLYFQVLSAFQSRALAARFAVLHTYRPGAGVDYAYIVAASIAFSQRVYHEALACLNAVQKPVADWGLVTQMYNDIAGEMELPEKQKTYLRSFPVFRAGRKP